METCRGCSGPVLDFIRRVRRRAVAGNVARRARRGRKRLAVPIVAGGRAAHPGHRGGSSASMIVWTFAVACSAVTPRGQENAEDSRFGSFSASGARTRIIPGSATTMIFAP